MCAIFRRCLIFVRRFLFRWFAWYLSETLMLFNRCCLFYSFERTGAWACKPKLGIYEFSPGDVSVCISEFLLSFPFVLLLFLFFSHFLCPFLFPFLFSFQMFFSFPFSFSFLVSFVPFLFFLSFCREHL